MGNRNLIEKHGSLWEEIRELELAQEKRKHLIALAVLKIFTQKGVKQKIIRHDGMRIEDIIKKKNEFELAVNTLKQQGATREKVQEAKIEGLQEEMARLRRELKERGKKPTGSSESNTAMVQNLQARSSFSTSPYVSKVMLNSIRGQKVDTTERKDGKIDNLGLTPAKKSGILSPIEPRKISLVPTKAKREYTNYNSMKKLRELNSQHSSQEGQQSVPATPERQLTLTRQGTSNKMLQSTSVLPLERSPSGRLFENKGNSLDEVISGSLSGSLQDIEEQNDAHDEGPDANSTFIERDHRESISGAIQLMEEESIAGTPPLQENQVPQSRKKRKLTLHKSAAQKSIADNSDHSLKSLHLDDEGLNTLNAYQDENFLENSENNESTPKSLKRNHDEMAKPQIPSNQKKKNVFRVD